MKTLFAIALEPTLFLFDFVKRKPLKKSLSSLTYKLNSALPKEQNFLISFEILTFSFICYQLETQTNQNMKI